MTARCQPEKYLQNDKHCTPLVSLTLSHCAHSLFCFELETLSLRFFSPLSDTVGCCMVQPITVFLPNPGQKYLHQGSILMLFYFVLTADFASARASALLWKGSLCC